MASPNQGSVSWPHQFWRRFNTKPLLFAIFSVAIIFSLVGLGIYRGYQISKLLGGRDIVDVVASEERVDVYLARELDWQYSHPFEFPKDPTAKVGEGTLLPSKISRQIKRLLLNPRSYSQKMLEGRQGIFAAEVVVCFTKAEREVQFVICIESACTLLESPKGKKMLGIYPMREDLARLIKPFIIRQPESWPPF
jgi:hypothetical protein